MSEQQRSKRHLMKGISQPILMPIFGRQMIANPSPPDGDTLGHTNHNKPHPPHQDHQQEGPRLDEGVQLITGIVDGVEVVVDAVQFRVHGLEGDVVQHKVLWGGGEDGGG